MGVTGNFAEKENETFTKYVTFTLTLTQEKHFLCLQFAQFSSLKKYFLFYSWLPLLSQGSISTLSEYNLKCYLMFNTAYSNKIMSSQNLFWVLTQSTLARLQRRNTSQSSRYCTMTAQIKEKQTACFSSSPSLESKHRRTRASRAKPQANDSLEILNVCQVRSSGASQIKKPRPFCCQP